MPFLARGEKLEALLGFVRAPADFAWWLLCGSGGSGKTRLALRLAMLAHAEGWRAGFLPKEYRAETADLDAWEPQLPTLIVADYTLKRVMPSGRWRIGWPAVRAVCRNRCGCC